MLHITAQRAIAEGLERETEELEGNAEDLQHNALYNNFAHNFQSHKYGIILQNFRLAAFVVGWYFTVCSLCHIFILQLKTIFFRESSVFQRRKTNLISSSSWPRKLYNQEPLIVC